MTKLEILKETYDYYTQDVNRRGVNGEGCYYRIGDKMCAVGRCMTEKAYFPFRGTVTTYNSEYNLEASLKNEYKGHSVEFWRALQTWHDSNNNWNSTGLTTVGQKDYDDLVKTCERL